MTRNLWLSSDKQFPVRNGMVSPWEQSTALMANRDGISMNDLCIIGFPTETEQEMMLEKTTLAQSTLRNDLK
jgi:hypothetical protein